MKTEQCIFLLTRYKKKKKHYEKTYCSLTEVSNGVPNCFLRTMTTTDLTMENWYMKEVNPCGFYKV